MRVLLLLLISFISVAEENESPETVWVELPEQFKCAPNEITLNGSVTISFGESAFEELVIFRESDSTWLFLVVGSAPKEMNSLMSVAELKSTNILRLTPETTGFRWEANGYNENIFTNLGKYTVYNSDILESEVGGYKCEIVVVGN